MSVVVHTKRSVEQVKAMIGKAARIGDVVALGMEPYEPAGRIIALVHNTSALRGTVVQLFDGEVRTGALGLAWCGYCPREEWDGPVPNSLARALWPEDES